MWPGIWWITRSRSLSMRSSPTARPGKVIGRQGRIAKEIRTLIRSVAQRSGKRVSVEIVD